MPRTCGAARSARRPVKAEVAGSNPVRSAAESEPPPGGGTRLPGRVAQLVERAPEKREVTGSTPVPTTGKTQYRGDNDRRLVSYLELRAHNVPTRDWNRL
jgi:hypothetical protein